MDLNAISILGLASRKMDWLSERQKTISSNIANANTPGFKSRDLAAFDDMVTQAAHVGPVKTHGKHLSGSAVSRFAMATDHQGWEERLDGNNVVLEQQTLMANETFEKFTLASQVYRKSADLLTMAVVGNR